jgi:hypothetical protein
MGTTRIFFCVGGGGGVKRKFYYRLIFQSFQNNFTDFSRVVGLYNATYMKPHIKIIVLLIIFGVFPSLFNFFSKTWGGRGDRQQMLGLTPQRAPMALNHIHSVTFFRGKRESHVEIFGLSQA